jgi:superfamily II DNA or RNA helicase
MKAKLTYLGRMASLAPAQLGDQFKGTCEIQRTVQVPASEKNGWQSSYKQETHTCWWHDIHPETKESVFVTFSGFGPRIHGELVAQGHEVDVEDLVATGLPEKPDVSIYQGVEWRGSQPTALIKLLTSRCGVITCGTGWGKTFLIRQFIRAYPDARVVITVPSYDVAMEIFTDLVKATPTQVGFVGDGKRSTKRIQVAITQSLGYCNREANLVIVDEIHAVLTPNFLEMFVQFRRARFFGFTATPDGRSDGGDAFLEALFGPVIHHVPYQEAVQSGNVCQLKYRIYPVPVGPRTTGIKQKYIKDRAGVWRNPFRNALISRVARSVELELGADAQILIMVSTTEHAFVLGQLLPDYVIVHGESLSKDEDKIERMLKNGAMLKDQVVCTKEDRRDHKAEFSAGTLKRAIATHVWSKGVNFLDLACLIRAEGTASQIASGQIPGRLSRLGSDGQKVDGLLIDFNDIFSPDFAARSNERISVYVANGWILDPLRGPV